MSFELSKMTADTEVIKPIPYFVGTCSLTRVYLFNVQIDKKDTQQTHS